MRPLVVLAFALGSALAKDAAAQSVDENMREARAAYDGAALAYARGDFVVAAREFGRADELRANDVALAQALESATRAGSAAIGMNLVERTHGRTVDADVQKRADEATAALALHASKIVITCAECDDAEVDNIMSPHLLWVEPGAHVVEMRRGKHVDRIEVHAVAGGTFEATPPPLPPEPLPVIKREVHVKYVGRDGVSPLLFWGAAGVTALAGGLTIASAVDTTSQHKNFVTNPNTQTASSGQSAEMRTNIALGITGAAAVTTAVIGVFFVRWSNPKKTTEIGLSISPSSILVGGHFQ